MMNEHVCVTKKNLFFEKRLKSPVKKTNKA